MEPLKFGFTAKHIISEGRVTEEDIHRIRIWLDTTKDIPKLADEQIVLFLLSCLNDLELTKNTIKSFYSLRNQAPDLFTGRRMDRPDIQKQLDTVEFSILPERTKDGCVIIFHRLYDTSFSNYEMGPSMKLLFMTLDAAIHDDPPNGLIFLFDMQGVGLMHLTKVRLGYVKSFFHYLQDALPVKLKVIHVLNSVYFIDKIMAIIKPFVKKDVLDLIHFYPPSMDMNTFYENHLPKSCLPEEFEGDLPSVRTLHEKNTEKLMSMESHFDAEEHQRLNNY